MKKQGKRIRCWSQELIIEERPLEVVANANPTLVPKGESPLVEKNIFKNFLKYIMNSE